MTDPTKNLVLIHDTDCFIAITHKYQLQPAGVYKDQYGNFSFAVLNEATLQVALDDYYDESSPFVLQIAGYNNHRQNCLEELSNIINDFDYDKVSS